MPRKKTDDIAPANRCSACGGVVLVRRPSKSGTHWCPKPECVRQKVRYYRVRQTDEAFKTAQEVCLAFFTEVAKGHFHLCGYCGQERAIPGWQHPAADWSRACTGSGKRGDGLPIEWIEALWPRS